jgi:hypothetical protein
VINTDAYFSNDQTSNGEVKGIDDEGKIKPAGSSQSRIYVRPRLKLTVSQLKLSHQPTQTLRKGELP